MWEKKKKSCSFFKWWEPAKQEYKIIARGVRMLDDNFEDNYELVAEKHKILEAINNLVAKSNSMIMLLSQCILYL